MNLEHVLSFLGEQAVSTKAYLASTPYPGLALLAFVVLPVSHLSARIEACLKYRGKLVCNAKRELRWDDARIEGAFSRLTEGKLEEIGNPYLIEAQLEGRGTIALLPVSRFHFDRARVGGKLPRWLAYDAIKAAVVIV